MREINQYVNENAARGVLPHELGYFNKWQSQSIQNEKPTPRQSIAIIHPYLLMIHAVQVPTRCSEQ